MPGSHTRCIFVEPATCWLSAVPLTGVAVSASEPPAQSDVPSAPARIRLAAAVAAAKASRATTPELRDAVCECVLELKGQGRPPEQVIVAIKTLVADGGIRRQSAHARPDWPQDERFQDEIVDSVGQWCVDAYFGDRPKV